MIRTTLTDRSRVTRWDPEFFETQYQVIKSRVVANRVVEMLRGEKEDVLSLLPATDDKDRFHPVAWVKSLVGMDPKDEPEAATDPDDRLAQSISEGTQGPAGGEQPAGHDQLRIARASSRLPGGQSYG